MDGYIAATIIIAICSYLFGLFIGMNMPMKRSNDHNWTPYDPPHTATDKHGQPILVQRRTCKKCEAADYRRATLHG